MKKIVILIDDNGNVVSMTTEDLAWKPLKVMPQSPDTWPGATTIPDPNDPCNGCPRIYEFKRTGQCVGDCPRAKNTAICHNQNNIRNYPIQD